MSWRDSQREKVYSWERRVGFLLLGGRDLLGNKFVSSVKSSFLGATVTYADNELAIRSRLFRADKIRYAWHQKLSLDEAIELVDRIWKLYGRALPPKVQLKGGEISTSNRFDGIRLSRLDMRAHVVIHEAAHSLVQRMAQVHAGHGPEFVTCVIDLYAHFFALSRAELRRLARAGKVRCARKERSPQRYGRGAQVVGEDWRSSRDAAATRKRVPLKNDDGSISLVRLRA